LPGHFQSDCLPETFERLQSALAGRYAIERELGHGAMATVFLAQDVKHRRQVALKVLRPDVAATVGPERFVREIDIAAHLTHPHILALHDSGSAAGFLYFVMPFIEGDTLRERLTRETQLPAPEALQIAAEVAEALDYAHSRGVVHRDIKPENILLAGGHAVVADFGIAHAVSEAGGDTLTATGMTLGTPAYMSPEQAAGAKVDGRSDQYALACVVYEMLSGAPPFTGAGARGVLARHLQESPRSLRVVRPTLPRHVIRAVEVALAKLPADRFATAGAFQAALTGAHPTPRPGRPWRLPRRGWVGVVAVAGIAVLARVSLHGAGAVHFGERDWILVADFDGPPDDPGMADALRELTTAELNQSRYLSTLPRQQLGGVLRSAGKPDSTHVTPEIARELAYRSAIRAVLVGSVSRLGRASYSIVLQVIDAEAGTDIVSVAGAAADSNIVPTVQRLAREVREGLGERRGAIQANLSLEQAATPSFEAYRRYVEGVTLQYKGDGVGSNRVLREALSLDTGFASAWHVIGWNYLNERMLDSARIAFAEALKRPDRLGVPRRYRVEAEAAYTMRYDLPAAVRACDLYLQHFPRSYSVLNNRGLYLLALGRYEEALADFERAVAAHPFGARQAQIQLLNQVATLVTLGQVDRARAAARDLTGPFATYIQLLLATATDDWVGADSVAAATAGAPSAPNWLRVQAVATGAAARAARGGVDAADRALADAAVGAPPDVARWYERARLLLADAAGRAAPPLPAAADRDTSGPGLITYGLWAAQLGDSVGARRRLRRVLRLSESERARLGYGSALLQARLAAGAGRWADVVASIGPAAARGEHDSALLDRVNTLALRWTAADAYEHLGHVDSALALLELVVRPTRMPGSAFALRGLVFPFAHERMARLAERLGVRADARRHWSIVLATLTHPDPDLAPTVAEARRARDSLQ